MTRWGLVLRVAAASAGLVFAAVPFSTVFAQQQAATADATADTSAPAPLSEDELEVLVARIALYPDELIAVISGASLYPLQIVEAERYLEQYAKDKSLKPKDTWDGSVVSLLNYPEIVKMMSDDLDWTQQFGDALAYQQKDVLIAIQQLREEAVAKGIIKTDDKVKVVEENDNIVIQSASTEKVYVPRYEPEMLYEPGYAVAPISYYPEPYPSYWYPTATFFAAAVTGAAWAAVVDWDDWGVWGGRWGNDVDIDCNGCFNNRDFNGKVNFNDVDWKNVDRSKINIDRNQFAKFDRTNVKNRIEKNSTNSIRNRASNIRNERKPGGAGRTANVQDVRKSTLEGLKAKPDLKRPDGGNIKRPDGKRPDASKANLNRSSVKKPTNVKRSSGKAKPAARADNRPKKPSGLGHVGSGKKQKIASNRGAKAMGGGARGGHRAAPRGGGGRQMAGPRGGGGHRSVHRGGGGRRR
ncbi:hypothetical protein MesoLjLc_47420 [Mesorhizobium sp. L-8-10]|uniref:DUF3300 domain-containing protein n=1 Tax=unclassified Mesorhizobium TaxID=325217 RepID=UPI001927CBE5|nr:MULTISPECIES: DUF3300 domain-containing protein [unclassified Mesorhizobium]BCH25036.1 hypothetical protein MesoLjLb_48210 [Mesorhizobium sp. L-8-3]BCH32812.1 hypothetical protein MesoLjLc_47420 [Mesorhizobium sp. L-8-10]